jgi:hypothetical protein
MGTAANRVRASAFIFFGNINHPAYISLAAFCAETHAMAAYDNIIVSRRAKKKGLSTIYMIMCLASTQSLLVRIPEAASGTSILIVLLGMKELL